MNIRPFRQTLAWLLLILAAACAPDHVDRTRWQSMQQTEKLLYVKSLIGAEKVKDAKGGRGRAILRPAEEVALKIDAAYARGDRRDAQTIFESLEPAR